MSEEVVGFTAKQRRWFLERDEHQCQFRYFRNGKWVRCRATRGLQIHHIIPRGWSKVHMPKHFPVNGSLNGITLCARHHVGRDSVHPDTHEAKMQYNRGNKNSFKDMMDKRKRKNQRGIPYWNTQWDWMFTRIVKKQTARFARVKPYPENGNRGNNGRL